MVQFRPKARELIAKVVYYGPPLGGKTTNLRAIFAGYPTDIRGELIVVPTGSDRTIFFDFLPVDLGMLRGMRVRVQLYTVPGQVRYNATRQVVLRGVDGVVFVADSQRALLRNNKESWENLKDNLILQGLRLAEVPHVVQYNKRDLKDLASIEELDELLNEFNAPFYEAVASVGIGVEETLQGMVKLVIRSLRERFQLDGEQALTQPVHMGLRGVAERALMRETDEAAGPEPLPAAEELPPAVAPEVTLVNYRPAEGGPFDPFRTQSLFATARRDSGPATPGADEPRPEPADGAVGSGAIFEEATHPDLEAQVERLRWDHEPDAGGSSLAAPEVPAAVGGPAAGPVIEGEGTAVEAAPAAPFPDWSAPAGTAVPAAETAAPTEPFAVTGDVPPLSAEDLDLPESEAVGPWVAPSEPAAPPAEVSAARELFVAGTEGPAVDQPWEERDAAEPFAVPAAVDEGFGPPAAAPSGDAAAARAEPSPFTLSSASSGTTAAVAEIEDLVQRSTGAGVAPVDAAAGATDDRGEATSEPFAPSEGEDMGVELEAAEPVVELVGGGAEPFSDAGAPETPPFDVEPALADEPAAAEPAPGIGIDAVVAAVRAHGDAEVSGGAISDEVEALAGDTAAAGAAFEDEVVPLAEPAAPAVEIEEDILGEPAWAPVATTGGGAGAIDEPFAVPAGPAATPFDEGIAAAPPPHVAAVEDVFAITPAPPRWAVPEPETVVVPVEISAVRRAAGRALAQYGEVRELELEVPVPGGWTGGRRMTLQLRLTLVPQEEDHER